MTNKLLLVCFLLFSFSVMNAQTTEKFPLSEILAKLAVRYDHIFSYANQLVEGQTSEMPPKSLSLEEALAFLEERTPLSFKNLGEGFVAVYAQKEISKTPFPQVLKTVVINDYLTKGVSKKPNGTVEIEYKNFGILPGLIESDVLQTLHALPGVQSVDETVSNINVRGGSNDQNLILWDGIRMYQSGHFFGLISAFNPYQTNKAVLIKNGTDPAFGNSVSSVISMQTDREVNRDFQASIGLNFINLGAFIDTPFGENASLQVSARTSLTPFFITPTYEQYYERAFQGTELTQTNDQIINDDEEFSFNDFSLRWLYDLSEKDRIRVNFINISNALGFDENAFVDGQSRSKKSELTQKSLAAGFFYKRKWNEAWQVSAQAYFSNYKLRATNVELLENQGLFQENKLAETGVKVISTLDVSPKFKWEAGYEFSETEISNIQELSNSDFADYDSETVNSHALFSSLNYISQNKSTQFSLGARLNYFHKFDQWRLEPRLAFYQGLGGKFSLEVLGELKSQSATQVIDFQTDFLGIEKRRWRLANDESIPVLRSKQLSLGINYSDKSWLVSAEGFLKEVGGITSQSQGFQNQYQFAQTSGSYFVKGIEFLLDKDFGNFSSWASYSLMDNTYTFSNLPLQHFPNSVEIVHSFNIATSYSYTDFKISLGLKWRSGKPFTPLTEEGMENGNLIYEPAFSENLKNYFRVDFSAGRSFKLGEKTNAHVGISVWNLLDRNNTLNSYYRKVDGEVLKIDQPGLGVTPNFSFRVFF